ncbi:vacuole protein [Pseudozyma hubeiensis SY62]|uniref:Palmitoyltransferase n=1 Tax=Pseudozyma hubeiensis (strain SY62) TaxID=1305764 RepID=R9PDD0_PSEHS|nr:vacuole protein [Pseudozyma hubeiensis SY62]GAC96115.1 vacuole protein [Pseudozyma hubeiensis SY62]
MTTAQTRSEGEDRTTSVVSTSSHTHVDFHDGQSQPLNSKTAVSHTAEAKEEPHQADVLPDAVAAPAPLHIPVTAHVGQANTNRQSGAADRPPPPKCLQSCIESIETCTQNVVRFNERMELNRAQAEASRQENGDPLVARKAIIPSVFVILSWVFLAYVWRLCSRLIQQNAQGMALGTRQEGIGLLVGFVILWLMAVWSYVVVISKGPGLVKDYVSESGPPAATAAQEEPWNGAQRSPQQPLQNVTQPMPIPGQSHQNSDESAMHRENASAPAASTSLPYPSFNADLERFGGNRASSDSMRVLPGSVEPKHISQPAELSQSQYGSRDAIAQQTETADTSVAYVERQLDAQVPPVTANAEPSDAAADPQLPGVVGPLAAAAVAEGQGMQEGAQDLEAATSGTSPAAHGNATASGWAPPQRRPTNDPPPLSASALYCHRCRLVKPPRAHHCRRCGVCVLKMDHHCPWVGGCVGAHNQRFFYIFVFWVTLLELYTLITTAIFFHRGVKSLGSSQWKVDGVLISLFPICAIFLIFTGALLGTHTWLMGHNMTTIEHVGISKTQGRERMLVERWFAMQKQTGLKGVKARRNMVREWDAEWGGLTNEGNRWWLGGEYELHLQQQADGAQEKSEHTASHPAKPGKGSFRTNVEQALGSSAVLWFVPLGTHPNEGLHFPMNPRFGEGGVQRKRQDWPPALR